MDINPSDSKDPKAQIILREETKKLVVDILGKEDTKGILNSREDMNNIVKEILDEALALGPLEDLLRDKAVSEIMVVDLRKYSLKRAVRLEKVILFLQMTDRLSILLKELFTPIGRRIDEKTPYVDARLHDGSRVRVIFRRVH